MKRIFTFILLISVFQGYSQSKFRPAKVITENFCSEFDIIGHSTFVNSYSASTLRFIRIQNTLSSQWTSAYCDCELCHDISTDSAEFYIKTGDSCVTSAHFYPANKKGLGMMIVKVFDPADRTKFVLGEYTATCWGASSVFVKKEELEIFPNPASTVLNVLFGSGEPYLMNIMTTDGKLVLQQKVGGLKHQVDISTLNTGLYTVKIESAGKVFSARFIKI